jgi:tRNA(adenine34) deaminase
MTPDELVALALEASEEGMRAGELPVGAVVAMGDEVIGRAYTQEQMSGRRLVHADLLAMEQADRRLGWARRDHPLTLAITLEPCLMCLGAAMALGVAEIYFGLEAPDDGAAGLASSWRPARQAMSFSHLPALSGGYRRSECRDQFRRYVATAPNEAYRRYAASMAALPDDPGARQADRSEEQGFVRGWNADEGWGVLDGPGVPGGCWAHFSAIVADGYRQLSPGQTVSFRFEPGPQDGFAYRAVKVWPDGPEQPSAAYQSTLTLTSDDPPSGSS